MQRRFSGFLALAATAVLASVASIPAAVQAQMEAVGRGEPPRRRSPSSRHKTPHGVTNWQARGMGQQREALRRHRRAQGGAGLERFGRNWFPRGEEF